MYTMCRSHGPVLVDIETTAHMRSSAGPLQRPLVRPCVCFRIPTVDNKPDNNGAPLSNSSPYTLYNTSGTHHSSYFYTSTCMHKYIRGRTNHLTSLAVWQPTRTKGTENTVRLVPASSLPAVFKCTLHNFDLHSYTCINHFSSVLT